MLALCRPTARMKDYNEFRKKQIGWVLRVLCSIQVTFIVYANPGFQEKTGIRLHYKINVASPNEKKR